MKALIVIDMLNDFISEKGLVYYPQSALIVDKVKKTLSVARLKNYLIIFAEHTYRKDKMDKNLGKLRLCCQEGSWGGLTIDDLTIDTKRDYVIKKRRYSCFFQTDLDLILREHNIKDIFLTGVKTNNCVYATALDGYNLDYNVYIIRDAVTTNKLDVNEIYLSDIKRYIGDVISIDEFASDRY